MALLLLPVRQRRLETDERGYARWTVVERTEQWPWERTALLLCDVWDRHWCRGANERLAQLVPRMDAVARHARSRGGQVIHAPSDTMEFYAGTPARERVLAAPPAAPPPDLDRPEPPLPVDATDEGADTGESRPWKAWSRQHPGIWVDDARDAVTDSGTQVFSYMASRRLDRLLIMGVHTNMCVLHRSFGIKQMVRWGVPVVLIRDLTDTMYNPGRPPYVSHEEGTRLVLDYVESFWCPTVASAALLAS